MISGRARLIASRSRDGGGLPPRQLQSIDGACAAQKKLYVFSTQTHPFTIDSIYTYTRLQNAFPISEITPFEPLCKIPKLPLNTSFLYRQGIYIIFRGMKRHKTTYFVPSDSCDDCYEMIMIHRKLKPKSTIRRIIWRAHNSKWIASLD